MNKKNIKTIMSSLNECSLALDNVINSPEIVSSISLASESIISSLSSGSKLYACGNGGSMADAMHLCEELSGRFRKDRRGLPAIAISDPCYLTCVANDFGYDQVFSRFLESNAKKDDLLFAISTSGSSTNILNAAKFAKINNLKVISLTGKLNSKLSYESNIDICTPYGEFSDRVQELHIKIIHIIVELIEKSMFPENYN